MRQITPVLFLLSLLLLLGVSGCGKQSPSASISDATPKESTSQESDAQKIEPQPSPQVTKKTIVIDAGHQQKANTQPEPIGPGASETKMKVTGGTAGVATGIPEYELTLTVSTLLKEELEARGYTVLLVRDRHDVDLSNRERADIANQAGADLFLRIHANGSEDPFTKGAMTLCPTPENPYPIGQLYEDCRLLADSILEGFTAATGAHAQMVWETDTMSGINWCQIPVTIVEMGYMSNPEEDVLLNTPDYQAKMVVGMANGVDAYFQQKAG
ncbi:N-acetylmuramoyl-L-alanine amidase [Evtepia sp.]|uniref:N-acetylmuramoyl-L-alanine amidase family protein n=1 Tax=Evtepia sp. TaxID=2773933 RepID=UPI002A764401|nr:N-acetylmuramoyl-L-alanine amidase [Evtepia sp.]